MKAFPRFNLLINFSLHATFKNLKIKKKVATAKYKITVLPLSKTQPSHHTNNYLHKSQKLSSLTKCVGKTEDANFSF